MPNRSPHIRCLRFCRAQNGIVLLTAVTVAMGRLMISVAADSSPQPAASAAIKNQANFVFNVVPGQANRAWSPEQVIGPPNVPAAGDNPAAWASLSQDDQPEWLICEFRSAVNARSVAVYENLAPGALVKLTAFNPEGKEVVAWEGKDPTPRTALRGVSLIPVRLPFPVQRIKVYLDSPAVPNWNEIDAVGIEDADGATHWTESVRASSTFASPGGGNANAPYSSRQVIGEPDTFNPGDRPTAWASASPDGQDEWLTLEFERAEKPVEIVVHENTSPGAITKISVFDPAGEEIVAWEGLDPTPRSEPWGVSVFPVKLDFPVSKVKLHIDSMAVPGYNEIDAVAMRSADRSSQWAKDVEASSTYGMPAFQPQAMAMMNASVNPVIQALAAEVKRIKEQGVTADVKRLKERVDELEKRIQQMNDKAK